VGRIKIAIYEMVALWVSKVPYHFLLFLTLTFAIGFKADRRSSLVNLE
jgi:hypothetical protein